MEVCRRLKWKLLKWWIRLQFPAVRHISTAELADWLEDCQRKNPLLLDARTPEEYGVSHLQQAQLSPYDLPELNDLTGLSPSTTIVTYCSKDLEYMPEQRQEVVKLGGRVACLWHRLSKIPLEQLEKPVRDFLAGLGKLDRPWLTALEEEILQFLEGAIATI